MGAAMRAAIRAWTAGAPVRELHLTGRATPGDLWARIKAGVLGVPLGVLTQRDKAYQLEQSRRRAKTLRRWLVVVGGLVSIWVLWQRIFGELAVTGWASTFVALLVIGYVLGVVSAADLMNLETLSPFGIRRALSRAETEDALFEIASLDATWPDVTVTPPRGLSVEGLGRMASRRYRCRMGRWTPPLPVQRATCRARRRSRS